MKEYTYLQTIEKETWNKILASAEDKKMIVHVTADTSGEETVYTADKTFDEILEAFEAEADIKLFVEYVPLEGTTVNASLPIIGLVTEDGGKYLAFGANNMQLSMLEDDTIQIS